jgi:S1-C subfamily serine protease
MEKEKQNIYTVVAIVVLVGVLLSCVVGALAGGATGFLVGRRQGQAAAERALEQGWRDLPRFGVEVPMPWRGEGRIPEPDPEGAVPPFGVQPLGMEGALITEVVPGTPAEAAGLEADDIIIAVDRTPIDSSHLLQDVIRQHEPGDRVTIRFWRADEEDAVLVKLAKHPDDPGRAYLGIYFQVAPWPGFEPPSD